MDELEQYLADEDDMEILKHCEVHFGGHFPTMIEYYEEEGKGIREEFSLGRIRYLMQVEEGLQTHLAAEILSGTDAEEVALARQAYQMLRDLYEESESGAMRLIADLIFSDEDPPLDEMKVITAKGESMVPYLIELLLSEQYSSPLFPGFGLAPGYAAEALGQLGCLAAVVPLFEMLGKGDFNLDEKILGALRQLKPHAVDFLKRVIKSHPITSDNERAAMALSAIEDSAQIAHFCLEELLSLDLKKHPVLASYLVMLTAFLESEEDRLKLYKLTLTEPPQAVLEEINYIVKHF